MNTLNFTQPLIHKNTEIPFSTDTDFTWQRFEILCKDLAATEYKIENVRPYGVQGDNQEGIDIYAYDLVKNKYLTIQCKKVKNYTPTKITLAVNTFLNGEFKDKSYRFILCCTDQLNKGKRQLEIEKQTLRLADLGIEFLVWDFYGINSLLKIHPQIVGDTFGHSWVKAFNGEHAFEEYMKKVKSIVTKPEKNSYDPPENYIRRTVTSIKNYAKESFYYNRERESIMDLIENESNKKLKYILLSQGGNGKSSEISHLANFYSKPKSKFFPIKVDLRNLIEGEKIEELLIKKCKTWHAIEDESLLLLFDGLDEVGVKEYQEFIKRINIFSEEHKGTRIIITSRTNYFNSLNGNNLLANFEVIFLNDLTREQIDEFLSFKLKEKRSEFYNLSKNNGFENLLVSPFYLISLTEIFLETYLTNNFPKTKANILSLIIEKQFEKEIVKFAFSNINISQHKIRVHQLLKLVAFSMTQLGRNSITLNEFQMIILNENDRKILKYSLLDFVNDEYQFNHNLIQEYLTGLQLKDFDVKTIKQLVSFKPTFTKIKNKWLNSLCFLLSILPQRDNKLQNLTEWLVEIEPEVLIMMEPDKFSGELRIMIVQKIIEKYKNKGVRIPYYYFEGKDLGKFAGFSKKLLNYCLTESTNSQNPLETRLLCISILSKFENFFGKEKIIKKEILECAAKGVVYPYLQEQAIRCLGKLHAYIDVDDCYDYLIINCKNIDNRIVRNGMYELIENLDFREDFIDFSIDGIRIINNTKGTSVMNEEKPIEKIFLRANTPKAVRKIFNLLINERELLKDNYSRRISFDKDFLKSLVTKAANFYSQDSKFLTDVIKLIESLHFEYYHKGYYQSINHFFSLTKTSTLAFNYFYKKSKGKSASWLEIEIMLLFANRDKLKRVFSDYEKNYILKEYLFTTLNLLNSIDIKLHDWFYSFINMKSSNTFLYTPPSIFDWNKHRAIQNLNNQAILLSKKLFLKEVKKVFVATGKTELSKDELVDYNTVFFQNEDKMNNTLIIPFLRDLADEFDKINYKLILDKYKIKKRWELYVVSQIAYMLNGNQTINEELKNFAISYIHKNISTIDMRKSVTDIINGEFTHTYFCGLVNSFCQKMELNLSQTALLDILYTDFQSVYDFNEIEYNNRPSNYVLNRVSDNLQLKKRILHNLKGGHIATPVIGSHFYLCKQLKITEAKSFLYKELIRDKFSEHAKIKILDIYLELGGEISDLLEMFLDYTKIDYWYWHLAEKLVCDFKEIICENYVKLLNSDDVNEEDKVSISLKILRQGKFEGIKFFCNYVIKHQTNPYDYHFWQNSDAKFPIKISINLLLRTLKVPFSLPYSKLNNDSFNRLDEAIYSLLYSIGLQSEEAFVDVTEGYKKFIEKYEFLYPRVSNINYQLQALENQYYKNKEEKITMKEVLQINNFLKVNLQ